MPSRTASSNSSALAHNKNLSSAQVNVDDVNAVGGEIQETCGWDAMAVNVVDDVDDIAWFVDVAGGSNT